MTGELVRELELGYKPAGQYVDSDRAVHWDGRNASGEDVASGIYYCIIQAGKFIAARKMVMLK